MDVNGHQRTTTERLTRKRSLVRSQYRPPLRCRSTRPATLGLTDNPAWRGLQIIDIVDGGPEDDTGVVEFRATYVPPAGGIEVMHERSRFVRENGCWYYVGPVR